MTAKALLAPRLGRLFLALVILVSFCVPVSAKAETQALGSWTVVSSSAVGYFLSSVAMASPKDGWAVGYNLAPNGRLDAGVLLRWDGSQWSLYAATPSIAWLGVSMLSASEGWLSGGSDFNAYMAHWDGVSLTSYSIPGCTALHGVTERTPTDVWAVGGSCIAHYNGTSWSTVAVSSDITLYSVAPITDSNVWTAGLYYHYQLYGSTYACVIGHWTGGAWTLNIGASSIGTYLYLLRAISAVSADDIWVAGDDGYLGHWNGAAWTATSLGQSYGYPTLYSLKMLSAQDGWVVGAAGNILHWDGTNWNSVTSPTSSDLLGVTMLSPYEGWAVGADGTILHYTAPWPNHIYLPGVRR